jgi:hypothetical protein
VRVKACRMRALRGFEGVREVTELSFTYGDAGAVISDVNFDEDWDLAGPGFFGDAVEEADVVWVVYEEGDGVWSENAGDSC